jgi:hypothetical protein
VKSNGAVTNLFTLSTRGMVVREVSAKAKRFSYA